MHARACACVCVCAGNSVSVRVLCFSVCQFHFALSNQVGVPVYYYSIDCCVNIYAFHAFVELNDKVL